MENQLISSNVMAQNKAIALAYVKAMGQKQFDKLIDLLHPDVAFVGSMANYSNATSYLSALQNLGAVLLRNDVWRIFAEEDEICVIYDMITDTPVGAVACVEWLNIDEGRIISIQLIFDRHRWPEVMDEMRERVGVK